MVTYRYIPVLRMKQGEKAALQKLSRNGREMVVPLFMCAPEQYVGKKSTRHRATVAPPQLVVDEIKQCWGHAPLYIDASFISPSAGEGHPMADIAELGRISGLQLIPATRLNAHPVYQAAVSAMSDTDGRGVALRIDLQEMTTAAAWASDWKPTLAKTDLITDLGDNVQSVAALGAALDPAFSRLHGAGKWRSVAIAGTSLPSNFGGYQAGAHKLDRVEFLLWRRLAELKLPYRLDFSDYATVPTDPPPKGIAWGYPINVKYTQPEYFFVCRGIRTTGKVCKDMDIQLREHSAAIVAHKERMAVQECWADDVINKMAIGQLKPGGMTGWVSISVNRHIELTRHVLA